MISPQKKLTVPSQTEEDPILKIKTSLSNLAQYIGKETAKLKEVHKTRVMDTFAESVNRNPLIMPLNQLYDLEQSQQNKQLSLCAKFLTEEELELWQMMKVTPKMKSLEESIFLNQSMGPLLQKQRPPVLAKRSSQTKDVINFD